MEDAYMVRTLLALGLGLTLAGGAINVAQGADHEYVGVKKCKSCHKKELIGNQLAKWQESKHSKAFEVLKSDDAVKLGKEKGLAGPPHEAPECLECHTTAYGVDAAQLPKGKPLAVADGVSCEACHGPGKDYRKKKTMADHDKSVAAGMWEADKDEKICLNCHNDKSPTWDTAKYKLADGSTAGFDFDQAKEEIAHPIPEDVKGKYIEVEKKMKAEKKGAGADEE